VTTVVARIIPSAFFLVLSALCGALAHAQRPDTFAKSSAGLSGIIAVAPSDPTPSFPPTDASLTAPVAPAAPDAVFLSSITVSDPGDLATYTPRAEFSSEAVPSRSALPAQPAPRQYGSRYEQFPRKWELGVAFALVRFRSSIYFATAPGLNTSLSYSFTDRLAVEGAVTSAFAPPVFENEHFRYLGYGGGPKILFGHDRLRPWAHALVGGVHLVPQTAASGRNGFEVTMGGGANYTVNDVISIKAGVDYLGTHMFGEWQSSFQFVIGVALSF
jgi:hypothetical protein